MIYFFDQSSWKIPQASEYLSEIRQRQQNSDQKSIWLRLLFTFHFMTPWVMKFSKKYRF